MVQRLPSIHLAGDQESANIEQEINLVIEKEIANLAAEKGLSGHAQTILQNKLQSTSNWNYLWLDLVLREIRESEYVNSSEIEEFFSSLPISITSAYDKILNRCRDQVLARQLFQLVLAAVRPLEVEELNVALALVRNAAARSYQDIDLSSSEHFATRMRNVCGLFLQIFNNRVYLYHQTAREYLLQHETHEQHSYSWQHTFNLTESHRLMLEACINLLMFDVFEDSPPRKNLRTTDRSWSSWDIEDIPYFQSLTETEQKKISRLWHQQKEPKGEYISDLTDTEEQQLVWRTSIWIYARSHYFLIYAASSWTDHYENTYRSRIDISKLVAIFITPRINEPQPTGRLWTWWSIYRMQDWTLPDIAPPLVLGAWMGNSDLIRRILFYGLSLEELDSDGHTALSRAARESNELVDRTISERLEVSKILLEHGASPNPPILCARWYFKIDDTGSEFNVRLLVEYLLACLLDDKEYVLCNLLHEYGVSLEDPAHNWGMPLIHYCIIPGRSNASPTTIADTIRWLLKKGVDASSYFASLTPLHRAAATAMPETVQLLLDYRVCINEATRDKVEFCNPPSLERFAHDGWRFLGGKALTVTIEAGSTVLHIGVAYYVASCMSCMNIQDHQDIDPIDALNNVKLLLEHGADVNYENELGMTPLGELYDQLLKFLETIVDLCWPGNNSPVISRTSTPGSTEYANRKVSSFGMNHDDRIPNQRTPTRNTSVIKKLNISTCRLRLLR